MYKIRLITSAKHTNESLKVTHQKSFEVELLHSKWHSSGPKPYVIQR